jgi:hypothetical protein
LTSSLGGWRSPQTGKAIRGKSHPRIGKILGLRAEVFRTATHGSLGFRYASPNPHDFVIGKFNVTLRYQMFWTRGLSAKSLSEEFHRFARIPLFLRRFAG